MPRAAPGRRPAQRATSASSRSTASEAPPSAAINPPPPPAPAVAPVPRATHRLVATSPRRACAEGGRPSAPVASARRPTSAWSRPHGMTTTGTPAASDFCVVPTTAVRDRDGGSRKDEGVRDVRLDACVRWDVEPGEDAGRHGGDDLHLLGPQRVQRGGQPGRRRPGLRRCVTRATGRRRDSSQAGGCDGGSHTRGPTKQNDSGQSARGYSNTVEVR